LAQKKISKKEQRLQQIKQEKQRKTLMIAGPIVVVVLFLAVGLILRLTEPDVEGTVFVESAPANQHELDITYEPGDLPPTGGVHQPTWQNCGIYDQPVAAEYAIHAMEHGAIWVTYQPELANADVSALQDMLRGDSYVILSPYPGQTAPIALTGWDLQLTVDSVADSRITEFVDKYTGSRGPESGASCSGGVGVPIG